MVDICLKCNRDKNYKHERDGSQMCWCSEDVCGRKDDVTNEPCQNPPEAPGSFCSFCRVWEAQIKAHDDALQEAKK